MDRGSRRSRRLKVEVARLGRVDGDEAELGARPLLDPGGGELAGEPQTSSAFSARRRARSWSNPVS